MIIGDLLLEMAGDPYFGPPMSRQSHQAAFTVQASNTTGSPTLVITIEHRNLAEARFD